MAKGQGVAKELELVSSRSPRYHKAVLLPGFLLWCLYRVTGFDASLYAAC